MNDTSVYTTARVTHFKIVAMSLICATVMTGISVCSWADDGDDDKKKNPVATFTKEICDPEKSNADGLYQAKLSRDVVAAYVMCSGTTSLVVTVNTKMGSASGTMAHILLDAEN